MSTSIQHHPKHASYGDAILHSGGQRCCETGRPLMTDPITGSIICSCQMQAGTQAYLTRVPTLPEHIYGSLHSQYQPHSEVGQPPFYPTEAMPADRRTEGYKVPLPDHTSYYYNHLMAAHPYNSFHQGFDLNAARRKNATRETTGPLKAWLNAHRKNPYPTKGEKVMLAIITRMTLTQVSTWFANARRRLKKDNTYGENDYDSDDKLSRDDSIASQTSFTEDDKRPISDTSGISDISDADAEVDEVNTRKKTVKKCVQRLFSPDTRNDIILDRIPSPEDVVTSPLSEKESESLLMPLCPASTTENTGTNKNLPSFHEGFLCLKNSVQEHCPDVKQETENSANIVTVNGLTVMNAKDNVNVKVPESDLKPVVTARKPKIWSISEILDKMDINHREVIRYLGRQGRNTQADPRGHDCDISGGCPFRLNGVEVGC